MPLGKTPPEARRDHDQLRCYRLVALHEVHDELARITPHHDALRSGFLDTGGHARFGVDEQLHLRRVRRDGHDLAHQALARERPVGRHGGAHHGLVQRQAVGRPLVDLDPLLPPRGRLPDDARHDEGRPRREDARVVKVQQLFRRWFSLPASRRPTTSPCRLSSSAVISCSCCSRRGGPWSNGSRSGTGRPPWSPGTAPARGSQAAPLDRVERPGRRLPEEHREQRQRDKRKDGEHDPPSDCCVARHMVPR